MKRLLRNLLIFFAVIVFLVAVLPLIVPIPPLLDTQPASQLADADSRFIQVNGLSVHYKQSGSGEPALILLHGFGASTFSWREVIQPFAQFGTVVAYDRPAFGLTDRPLPGQWQAENPYGLEGNTRLLIGLMDALGIRDAVLVGHSAGAQVAVRAALEEPERVRALILVAPAIDPSGGSGGRRFGLFAPFVESPQMDRLGPFFARALSGEQGSQFIRTAWHDPSKITPEIEEGYRRPLQVENWDTALWEYTKAGAADAPLNLAGLTQPVLIISGDDDRIVPADFSRQLAGQLAIADLVVLPGCGHLPHEECPAAFLEVSGPFLSKTKDIE